MTSKTFNRYLFSQLLKSFLVIFVVLQVIAASRGMIRIFEHALAQSYPSSAMLWALVYSNANTLLVVIPFSAMLASLLTLGRYHHHRELHAIASMGIGYSQFLKVMVSFCVPLALVLMLFSLGILPLMERYHQEIVQSFKENIHIDAIGAKRFAQVDDKLYVFAEKYNRDKNELENIFIAQLDEALVVIAKYGRQEGNIERRNHIDLYQGHSYQGKLGQDPFNYASFKRYTLHLLTNKGPVLEVNPRFRTTPELLESATLVDISELQRRLSMPVILVISVLFALMLYQRPGYQNYKNTRYLSLIQGVVFFLIYANTAILLTKIGASYVLFLYLGWVVHLGLLGIIFAVLSGKFSALRLPLAWQPRG